MSVREVQPTHQGSTAPVAPGAADRFVTDPSHQALVPCCRRLPSRALPEHTAHPGRLSASTRIAFGGGPGRSRLLHRPRTTRQQHCAELGQATTFGVCLLRACPACRVAPPMRAASNQPRPSASVAPPCRSELALVFCSVSPHCVLEVVQDGTSRKRGRIRLQGTVTLLGVGEKWKRLGLGDVGQLGVIGEPCHGARAIVETRGP